MMNNVPHPTQKEQTDTHRWRRGLLAFLLGLISLALCLLLLRQTVLAQTQPVTSWLEPATSKESITKPGAAPSLEFLLSNTIYRGSGSSWLNLFGDSSISNKHASFTTNMLGPLSSTAKRIITQPLNVPALVDQVTFMPAEPSGTFNTTWLSPDADSTWSIAWGDMDGDGDLDLAAGSSERIRVYRNDGGGSFTDTTAGDLAVDLGHTYSIAWGDMDGDGDLDLAAANNGQNKVYRNDGNNIFTNITVGDLAVDLDCF